MPLNHTLRRRPAWKGTALSLAVLLSLVLSGTALPGQALAQGGTLSTGAVVLVNDQSPDYADFQQLIQPYLDHFGIPYTVLNVRTAAIGPEIRNYALILIGHRQLDPAGTLLDLAEQEHIRAAVYAGTGLVNLDNDLSPNGLTPRYQFIQDVWGFSYKLPAVDWSVRFVNPAGEPGIVIDCTDDAHQDPVLPTSTDATTLVDDDGLWAEYAYPPRPVNAVFADAEEQETVGLAPFRCYSSGIPNGTYDVSASLYTDSRRSSMRYFYGYSAAGAADFSVDTESGSGGEDRFTDYPLGTVSITDGTFQIFASDADVLSPVVAADQLLDPYTEDLNLRANPQILASGEADAARAIQQTYPTITQTLTLFGWSSIRLVPTGTTPPAMPWITANHWAGEWIGTGSMTMAGLHTVQPGGITILAMSSSEPLLLSKIYGSGRAVQWGSYDWMSHQVKGPMFGLDDLVWRSIVWAARKPFVMQGMLPMLTMRVDDSGGPYDWVDTANAYGFRPFVSLFYGDLGPAEELKLAELTNTGKATASVHAIHGDTWFYYDDAQSTDLPQPTMDANYADATAWHTENNIPISKFMVPQSYEIGTNAFSGLDAWNVEFLATVLVPGQPFGTPWVQDGPFRLYEAGSSAGGEPLYYADWLEVPGHPEYNEQFFNCATEIRDDGGYEWWPSNDVLSSVGRGTRHVLRALHAMAVPMLVTHEWLIDPIDPANWNTMLQQITANLAPYNLTQVTVDEACQYARAMKTSDIETGNYSPLTGNLTVGLTGSSDMPTKFYLFTGTHLNIQTTLVDVPGFAGTTQVSLYLEAPTVYRIFLPLITR